MTSTPRERFVSLTTYLITKAAGAGFALSLFFAVLLLLTGFDWFEFVERISTPWYWLIFFGYGTACSIAIDVLMRRMAKPSVGLQLSLHAIAGFVLFFVNGFHLTALIAGTVGAVCALLYFTGAQAAGRSVVFRWIFAIVMPLTLITLIQIDFTKKTGWTEERTDGEYKASFAHFDGKHEIPLHLTKGERVAIRIAVTNRNGGGHGYHVLDENGEFVGMRENNDGRFIVEAPSDGLCRIVITGDDLQGSVSVQWTRLSRSSSVHTAAVT